MAEVFFLDAMVACRGGEGQLVAERAAMRHFARKQRLLTSVQHSHYALFFGLL